MQGGKASFRCCTRRRSHNRSVILEIRTYTLKPGSGTEFHRVVVDEVLPMLQRWGHKVVGFGQSLENEDAYFLIRAYPGLDDRQRDQGAFYGSDEWRDGPREAIVSRIESMMAVVVPAGSVGPIRPDRD